MVTGTEGHFMVWIGVYENREAYGGGRYMAQRNLCNGILSLLALHGFWDILWDGTSISIARLTNGNIEL